VCVVVCVSVWCVCVCVCGVCVCVFVRWKGKGDICKFLSRLHTGTEYRNVTGPKPTFPNSQVQRRWPLCNYKQMRCERCNCHKYLEVSESCPAIILRPFASKLWATLSLVGNSEDFKARKLTWRTEATVAAAAHRRKLRDSRFEKQRHRPWQRES